MSWRSCMTLSGLRRWQSRKHRATRPTERRGSGTAEVLAGPSHQSSTKRRICLNLLRYAPVGHPRRAGSTPVVPSVASLASSGTYDVSRRRPVRRAGWWRIAGHRAGVVRRHRKPMFSIRLSPGLLPTTETRKLSGGSKQEPPRTTRYAVSPPLNQALPSPGAPS